jgi:hypothetical protein
MMGVCQSNLKGDRMQQWCDRVRPYSGFVLLMSFVMLTGACWSDIRAPLSIRSPQGVPVVIGAITFTGTSAVIDATLQVSVTIRNDSTAPVSFGYGPCGLNFALYQTAANANSPIWQKQQVCQTIDDTTVAAGTSLTVTGSIPIAVLTQGVNMLGVGIYSVTAYTIHYGANNNFSGIVDAGTVAIQYLPPWSP